MSGRGFNLQDYATVDDRITNYWAMHPKPEGSIQTEIVWVSDDGNSVAIRATVYQGDRILATGIAQEERGPSGANRTSWWENAETSAIGRALANMDMSLSRQRPSRQEMEKVERYEAAQPAPARNAAPAFATPRPAPAPAPAARQDEAQRARADALTQFGPIPATLPEVEAQLAPLAKQVRTNDESLSPGEYQRYHDLEAKRKELLAAAQPESVKLTEDQEKTIAQAWEMAEAAETYGATAALMRTLKIAATEEQWAEINRRWSAIRRKHYPQTTQAARPAAYAG
jgi:hypothetical protein